MRPSSRLVVPLLGCVVACALAGARADTFYGTRFERVPSPAALTEIGRAMFFDPALSASGTMSCASCHDPRFAFGPPNAAAVQRGGPSLDLPGVRAVPSLRYLQTVPSFTEHYAETDGNDSEDQGPAGGNNWDGRAPTKHDQARIPLLSPFEMANASEDDVVARLARSPYAARMRDAFGPHLFDDHALAFKAALLALEVFQQSPADFYPYTSKYDAVLRHQAALTAREARGLALFEDANKGNCSSCHVSRIREGAFPAFTDFGFAALGVPRNPRIPANRDPRHRDLGLCGPLRTDLATHAEYCGRFRAPSLRNVAVRRAFFHNGEVTSLADAVRFYVERDTRPARWYPTRRGRVVRDDDLPRRYRGNLDVEAPFAGIAGRPALDAREIADIVAFLETLTDGWQPVATATRSKGLMLRAGGGRRDADFGARSTKNADGERDPEMHQTKKVNPWHFGMKAHIGADAASDLVHTVIGTAANVADVTQGNALSHGDETDAFGDTGSEGIARRDDAGVRTGTSRSAPTSVARSIAAARPTRSSTRSSASRPAPARRSNTRFG